MSIDTTKAKVAWAAVEAAPRSSTTSRAACLIPSILEIVDDRTDVTYIAGHFRGRTLAEVFAAEAPAVGSRSGASWPSESGRCPAARVWVDPGIGFGKGADPESNADLLRHAGDIQAALNKPIVIGAEPKAIPAPACSASMRRHRTLGRWMPRLSSPR